MMSPQPIALCLLVCTALAHFVQGQPAYTGNPILDHFESADPQIAFVNNCYYLYPTDNTREDPGFSVWSSDNLKDWTNEGNILSLTTVLFASARPWAPGFAQRNGRYYFYFSADDRIGVAVSDAPTGPFKEVLGKPLIAYQPDLSTIDPMTFIDDDGQAYLYWGAVPGSWRRDSADVIINSLMVRKLNKDMVTPEGPTGYTIRSTDLHIEASYVFKRQGVYYLMYSAGNWDAPADSPAAYRVEYATADSPLGPFRQALNNPVLVSDLRLNILGPGHNSVLHLPGTEEWYIVYHAHGGEEEGQRQVFINRLEFDAQSQIKAIKPDRQGVKPRPIQVKLTLAQPGPFRAGETIVLEASSDWPTEEIRHVKFFAGEQLLATLTRAPYRYAWKEAPPGFYPLYVHATHRSGEVSVSSAWNVDVEKAGK